MPALCTPGVEADSGSVPRRLLIAVLAQTVVPGCSRPRPTDDPDVHIDATVTPQPLTTGTAQVEILIRDTQGQPLNAAAVTLEGTMSHPGMKPSFAAVRAGPQGRWLADLDLTMAGDWLLVVHAKFGDGREVERVIPLRGVSSR